MTYEATKKQQGLYRKLTGEWLPRKCSKSKASTLIKAALAGNGPKPEIAVRAHQVRMTMDACRADAATYVPPIHWEIQRNYYPVGGGSYETAEAALAAATAMFPGAEIKVGTGVAQICVD